MPDFIFFIGGLTLLILLYFGCGILLFEYTKYPKDFNFFHIIAFILLILLSFQYIKIAIWYRDQPPILEDPQILTVQTYDDFDSVIYNKKFINLNKLFGKDFEEGDIIKATKKIRGWYGSLYDTSNNYIIMEHGEDSVKYYER